MASLLKIISKTINEYVNNSLKKKVQSPRSRGNLDRDIEQEEEFQYASRKCLSSYYSVFVVRLTIMVMLAILIGMLTLLTWHFTKVYTRKSLENLAYGLRYELLQRPILRMWNILNTTVEITTAQVKLSEYVIRKYSKPVDQAHQVEVYEVMRDVTWALFASHKALNAITINYRNGFVQAFHRDHRSNNTFYMYSDIANYSITNTYANHTTQSIRSNSSAVWFREPLDPTTGDKIGKPRPIPPDDLINIAGISQVPDGSATWHVAVSKYTNSPLLSAALPVWDPSNNTIVAVVGVTTALYSVGQLMKELVEFHSGHIYLTSQQGFLLATSTNAPLLTNTANGPNLTMPTDSTDKVIRLGAEWLKKKYYTNNNNFNNKFHPPSQEVHVENARLGDQLYYIDSFFLNLKRLPMVGVLMIPRKYIMGKVDERAFKTLVILICASLCILIVGCVCIFILTSGVSKEMKLRAALICQLDARRKAEASSNYKSQFLANMSHELRTPMAAVIGLLDILMCDDSLTNEQYATITQIRKCSTALLRLLNNILDLSKVESGKLVLEEAEFDLGRELEGLVDMFSVQCINHNVEIILDLSDDMPRLVQGDTARVIQIFANLISNSIKFTSSGYIIVRGWCENVNTPMNTKKLPPTKLPCTFNETSLNYQVNLMKRSSIKENKVILWFEVDDTGCGIDPTKWEAVFESFEQADPSTTRTHGGTGLGLCIVRTLVNKMGGEIKVVKKNGPGTVMQFYFLLNTPSDISEQHNLKLKFIDQNIKVLLALNGRMGRSIMSQWLQKNEVVTCEASEWKEFTQILQELVQSRKTTQIEQNSFAKSEATNAEDIRDSILIIIVDVCLLDLITDIWKDQLYFLEKYYHKAKFAWILNHDTSNTIKLELRTKGHLLMVNRPLSKAKLVHILEAVIKDNNHLMQKKESTVRSTLQGYPLAYIDHSSDDCDKPETGNSLFRKEFENDAKIKYSTTKCSSQFTFTQAYIQEHDSPKYPEQEWSSDCRKRNGSLHLCSKFISEQKALDGLRLLLAEDTPVLQRVATIMLQKLGASVVVVGDGLQAIDALNIALATEEDGKTKAQPKSRDGYTHDLVLMDCQMPKMDGYEATKAIRKSELGTESHIPIVALTAHAMLSDEAKCLEVGMDAYLTKPIDCKLMVSTILSLTKRNV